MSTEIVLIGAGGHGKVVYDALSCCQEKFNVLVIDDDPARIGREFLSVKVCGPLSNWSLPTSKVHVAIGRNEVRERVAKQASSQGGVLYSVIHPAASLSSYAQIGEGVFLASGSIVGPATVVEDGVIVNHGAVVDHDGQLGSFCHIAPHATLGGGVIIGRNVLIGSGAVVLPGIRIGDYAVVGAGAVVTRSVESGHCVKGIPAKEMS